MSGTKQEPTTEERSSAVPSVVITRSNNTKLKTYTRRELDMENFDLIAKVKELLNTHNLWDPDGTYTFEDGERWAKLEGEESETTGE